MHHAQLFVGSLDWSFTKLPLTARTEGSDVRIMVGERMGIDDVRALTYEAGLMPLVAEYRVFVIAYAQMTPEAQNALLKLLEEPPKTAQFYVCIASESLLLPTLRSRLMLIATEEADTAVNTVFAELHAARPADRLSMVVARLNNDDFTWVDACMDGFETYAHANKNVGLLKDVINARRYLETSGASKKMILEHLVLSL